MKYWVTTQWPHLRTVPRDNPHNGVWVADEDKEVIAPMRSGDLVWIYESQSGRPIIKNRADGEQIRIMHHTGRGGVVTLVEVTAAPIEDSEAEKEVYADGSTSWWRWKASTKIVNSAGFIPRASLNQILNYKTTNALRGFGTKNSGLMQVSSETHDAIKVAFERSHEERDEIQLTAGERSLRGGGGEGPAHLALKNAIAQNPSAVLGEEGLILEKLEYAFGATGDRIDVLLRDRLGRFVAVEVEPACPDDHIAGPLQCMKYRALLAYHFDRRLEEVRTFLVTHELSNKVKEKSERFGIECISIALP